MSDFGFDIVLPIPLVWLTFSVPISTAAVIRTMMKDVDTVFMHYRLSKIYDTDGIRVFNRF